MRPYAPVVCCILILAATAALAATHRVDLNGGGDYLTIQEGVNAASTGDTVLVAAGTYTGALNRNLNLGGRSLVLISESGPDVTIIDAQNAGRVFDLRAGGIWGATIRGFTITRGMATDGGGMRCSDASPLVYDCTFVNNRATNGGAISFAGGTRAGLDECRFIDNEAADYGGAIYYYQPIQPSAEFCTFSGNSAGINGGAISLKAANNAKILYCDFDTNTAQDGGAAYVGMLGMPGGDEFPPTVFSFCTFFENTATRGGGIFSNGFSLLSASFCTFARNSAVEGGGIYALTDHEGYVMVQNCTLVFNHADYGGGVCCAGRPDYNLMTVTTSVLAFSSSGNALYRRDYVPVTTTLNVAYGNAGGDYLSGSSNLLTDPLFCGVFDDDFNLCENSPCRGSNNDWGLLIGAHRQICGSCTSPVEEKSWGSIKALYR